MTRFKRIQAIISLLLTISVTLPTPVAKADNTALENFLGTPISLPIQKLWTGGGGTNIVTTKDGTVVAFQSMSNNKIRRSTDGGATWGTEIEIGSGRVVWILLSLGTRFVFSVGRLVSWRCHIISSLLN